MSPRTLWACQPVAAMSSLSVAPDRRASREITSSVLVVTGESSCRAVQIRRSAVLRSVNFRKGRAPGSLFQIARSRSIGQSAVTEAKPLSLANGGPSRHLRAAPIEAYALALSVASMTNVFTAVFTWQGRRILSGLAAHDDSSLNCPGQSSGICGALGAGFGGFWTGSANLVGVYCPAQPAAPTESEEPAL